MAWTSFQANPFSQSLIMQPTPAAYTCKISDKAIANAFQQLQKYYSIRDIRNCFEVYCYTSERCAVCEEFYVDFSEKVQPISIGIGNITFCCQRCLFNGWLDLVQYLRKYKVNICMSPCCLQQIQPGYCFHTSAEKSQVLQYIKNDLRCNMELCSDPTCKRIGFDMSDTINFSSVDVDILEDYVKPKVYCSKKHATCTRIMNPYNTMTLKPKPDRQDRQCYCQRRCGSAFCHKRPCCWRG